VGPGGTCRLERHGRTRVIGPVFPQQDQCRFSTHQGTSGERSQLAHRQLTSLEPPDIDGSLARLDQRLRPALVDPVPL
jgi:hypothetical protein